jgi:hypothetical protein
MHVRHSPPHGAVYFYDLIAGNPDMIVFTQAKNPVREAASFVKTSAARNQAMTNDGHDRAPE